MKNFEGESRRTRDALVHAKLSMLSTNHHQLICVGKGPGPIQVLSIQPALSTMSLPFSSPFFLSRLPIGILGLLFKTMS
jgi:hypothetical protein